ncbi:integrase catalytic domain-containing protein [Trichonephila clavipes]|nr:integrase catalytic domain-containing protein [Trichonephila clavipes]
MTKGCVEIDLVSLHDPKVKLPVKAYVLEKLTAPLPTEKINEEEHFSHLKNACLADPKFFIPNNIDMILGSDYFFSILLSGQITCSQKNNSHDTRVEFSKDSNESSKVLGLFWNSSSDTFGFQPSLELTPSLTKRLILSESSKIFDPLGLLSPCIVFMKIFYQKLWLTKTDWDSPIPQQLTEDWLKFQKAFNAINYLTVPRWVILTADNTVEFVWASDKVKAELKSVSIFNLFTHTSNDVIHGLFEHYSSLTKLIRIFAYCQRLIKNCRKIASSQGSSISSSHINTISLTFSETKTAEETIIRLVQGIYIQEEIQSIKKQMSLPPKSQLRSLYQFIDEHGLVRVGGRLRNSQLRFSSKHPIILPSQDSISELSLSRNNTSLIYMLGRLCKLTFFDSPIGS